MKSTDVKMPKWGMTMQEGTVGRWLVKVHERISEGQVIATVETDKVDVELEAPVDGVIAEILVPAGATAEVGAVLARIEQ